MRLEGSEMIFILLLGLSALLSASAASPCLDEADAKFRCQASSTGTLNLTSCEIADEDVDSGDLASCLDTAGRGNITDLSLDYNNLTTLPEEIFQNLTSLSVLNLKMNQITLPDGIFDNLMTLTKLYLSYNSLNTLPEDIFLDLTALQFLSLASNNFTTLPESIFQNLTALETLNLISNNLTTLPAGIFGNLKALATLNLASNAFTSLPEGVFQGITALETLYLSYSALTTLPGGIFQGFTALEFLDMTSNDLTTLPQDVFQDLTSLGTLKLDYNNLTTLPAGIFGNLTALTILKLDYNDLTTLPANIFDNLTALATLNLASNDLTSLPEGVFQGITSLRSLYLSDSALTTLPEGIFQGLTALDFLGMTSNDLTTLPQGVFQNMTSLEMLKLDYNNLTTLPAGIFDNLTALTILHLEGNSLECLPATNLEELDDDATYWEEGIHVDEYGDECGCPTLNVTDNVCGEETCTPGAEGYTCASSTTAATPASSSISPTIAPVVAAPSTAPTAAPSPNIASDSVKQSASDSIPLVAGVVSAVAGVALVALAVFLKRRRASNLKTVHPPAVSPAHDDDKLERGRPEPLYVQPPANEAVLASGKAGDKSPSHEHEAWRHRHVPAEADAVDGRSVSPPSALGLRDGRAHSGVEGAKIGGRDYGAAMAGGEVAHHSAASSSAADMSTVERAELAQFFQRQSVGGESKSVDASGDSSGASSATDRNRAAYELRLGHAVLAAAQELAHHCQTPGISEAATAVCIMARLVTDGRDNDRASDLRLRQCRSIIVALKRAAKVADRGGDTMGEAARVLIEEVHEAIVDLVDLIRTFQSKNKLSKAFMSTLFKRRQDELDAVVDRAILRLQLGLQLQVADDVSAVKGSVNTVEDGMKAVKDDVSAVKEAIKSYEGTTAEAKSEVLAEARSVRRQRKLDQAEIPEDHLFITGDLLGKGGFGEVYLADYNGHNAAAKVLNCAHGLGALEQNQEHQETSQRRAFLRELEAMIRLRSPNTVNVYGAVTSLPDRMVLVMELLVGGDLLTLLRKSAEPLPEERCRRIIEDICTGMAFLHSKNTIHGDLKSANVLLDGDGRAKIADFGTSRWSNHTNSTGLATYASNSSQSTQMSIAWSAPEVLDSGGSTYQSDVYSFGIVVWEVFSRERPWANKTRPTEILTAVLRGSRPSFRVDAPADIVDIAKTCWNGEPNERTTFRAILDVMKAKGGSDEQANLRSH